MDEPLFEVEKDNRRKPLTLRPDAHEGGSGIVYELSSAPGKGIKDYFEEERDKHLPKVQRMMNVRYNRRHTDHFDLGWPEGLVVDQFENFRGFTMPFFGNGWVDLSEIIQSKASKAHGLGERDRLKIATNLAMAVNALHERRIHCIDLKPDNARVNLHTKAVALIDCDGMSVLETDDNALKWTDDFVPPENQDLMPCQFCDEEEHDRFSLATIIFMLLNEGRHPYAGIVLTGDPDIELKDKIKNNLFPHRTGKGRIDPPPRCYYSFLPGETKGLFDRAFSGPALRPSAEEWIRHLSSLELQVKKLPE